MKFPGKRKSKHYFPVSARDPLLQQAQPESEISTSYIVGIDQTLVDIEAKVDDAFVQRYGLSLGHSLVIEDDVAEALYQELNENNLVTHQFAGGTIGNTMHNYSVLADDRSVLLGVMCSNVKIGSYAYRYLCNTSSRTDLNYLQGVDGAIGRCFTLIGESGERTFAINPGQMNQLRPESIPEEVIAGASALVLSSYLVRCKEGEPMKAATLQAIEYAKKHDDAGGVDAGHQVRHCRQPAVVARLPEGKRDDSGDERRRSAGADRAERSADRLGHGAGVGGSGAVHRRAERPVYGGLHRRGQQAPDPAPAAAGAYRRVQPLRIQPRHRREHCENPLRVYSHIAPYMGGPEKIMNTNGAGDGALSALLHDIAANGYHRHNVPNSSKHVRSYLTYSSLAQVCKYANRVSYQVLNQHSPRLTRGLPGREDSLEESYWER